MPEISDTIIMNAGPLYLELEPGIGGSVGVFRIDDIDIMRPLSSTDRISGNVLGAAMFPMLPYANRIFGNAFCFRGKTISVLPNNPPEKYNVHGTGWLRPWTVVNAKRSQVEIKLDEISAGDSYAYFARQNFELDPTGLTVRMELRNMGPETMPFGFGLHPWFVRDPGMLLEFNAERFYLEEPENVAGDPISLPPELDFSTARPLPNSWRNNNYGGWDGLATLLFPSRGVGITLRAESIFKHLMLYSDPEKPFFCVEPQTNSSGAFNRHIGFSDPREGVVVLESGESIRGSVRFEIFRT